MQFTLVENKSSQFNDFHSKKICCLPTCYCITTQWAKNKVNTQHQNAVRRETINLLLNFGHALPNLMRNKKHASSCLPPFLLHSDDVSVYVP